MNRRVLLGLALAAVALVSVFTLFPWRLAVVSFGHGRAGDLHLLYRKPYSEADCRARGGFPLVGYAWSWVYAGCSPFKGALLQDEKVPRVVALLVGGVAGGEPTSDPQRPTRDLAPRKIVRPGRPDGG